MKLTRKQLKRFIFEALEPTTGKFTVIGMKNETASDNTEAIKVTEKGKKELIANLGITSSSGKKDHYIWAGAELSAVKGSSSDQSLYSVGKYTSGLGDPFTYEKVSETKFRVISGPVSKSIGKLFQPSGILIPWANKKQAKRVLLVNDLANYKDGKFNGNVNLQEFYKKYEIIVSQNPNIKPDNMSLDQEWSADNDMVPPNEAFKKIYEFLAAKVTADKPVEQKQFANLLRDLRFGTRLIIDFTNYLISTGLISKSSAPTTQEDLPMSRMQENTKKISRKNLREAIIREILK